MAATVTLTVTHADNEVAAWVNGVLVYDRKTENNPSFNDVVDLTPALQNGTNTLVVIGINWGAGADFRGSLTIGKFVTPFAFSQKETPKGMVWHQTFSIPHCC